MICFVLLVVVIYFGTFVGVVREGGRLGFKNRGSIHNLCQQ